MITYAHAGQKDFIRQLIQIIARGNKSQAIRKIMALPENKQIETIDKLAEQHHKTQYFRLHISIAETYRLVKNPVNATSLARALAHTLMLASELDQALNRTPNRARALAFAFDLTLDLDRNLDIERALAVDQSHNLAQELDSMLTHHKVSLPLTDPIVLSNIKSLVDITNILVFLAAQVSLTTTTMRDAFYSYYRKLADALDEGLHLQQEEPSDILDVVMQVIENLLEGNLRHITLENIDGITPNTNTNQIAPYLQALNDFLLIESEITNKPFNELRIVQIHNNTPKIELIGIGDSIRALIEVFQFQKRKDEARTRDIENQSKEAKLQKEKLENEVFQKEAEQKILQMELEKANLAAAAKAHLMEIEASAIRAQVAARQALLEMAQKEQEFLRQKYKGYLEEAAQYIERKMPHLPLETRLPYIARLALTYQQMDETGLSGRFGSHDLPRPPTLPE